MFIAVLLIVLCCSGLIVSILQEIALECCRGNIYQRTRRFCFLGLLCCLIITLLLTISPLFVSCVILILIEAIIEMKTRGCKSVPNSYFMKTSNNQLRQWITKFNKIKKTYSSKIDNNCFYTKMEYYVLLWRCLCHANFSKQVHFDQRYQPEKWRAIRDKYEQCLIQLLSPLKNIILHY